MAEPLSAVMIDVAAGAVELLNRQTFTIEAEAKRSWRPIDTVESTAQARIRVVPTAKTRQKLSRGKDRCEVTLSVVIERKHSGVSGQDDPVLREDAIAILCRKSKTS